MTLSRASSPATLRVATGHVDLARRVLVSERGVEPLSELEASLLDRLAQADGQPVSREVLLREVWGYHSSVRSRSVDHVVKRLRAKIERDRKHPEHLVTVHSVGYRLVASAPALPTPNDHFVGRQRELEELDERLAAPTLLTILGPGGIGKTALAGQIAHRLVGRCPGGVWHTDIDGVDRIDRVWSILADCLGLRGVRVDHDDTVPTIAARLATHGRCLVVLDGADRVARELGPALERVRVEAPEATVLITSRIRLPGTRGQVLELGSLTAVDGCELLWRRARAVRSDLVDDVATRATLTTLASRLDGIPLAIELAAARSNLLAPTQLLAHLTNRLALLSGPERTLASTLDASWALSSPAERAALLQLTVFRGGFRIEQARRVVRLAEPAPNLLDVVHSLRNQSWLRAWVPEGTEELRLGMFDSVRDYLEGRPEDRAEARLRHAEVFAELGAPGTVDAAHDPREVRSYNLEHPNVLRALDTALELERADLALPVWRAAHKWFHRRGPFSTAIELAERILCMGVPPAAESDIRRFTADLHRRQGDSDTAVDWARQALALAEQAGNPVQVARCQHCLGALLTRTGQLDEAQSLLEAAEQAVLDSDAWAVLAHVLWNLGTLHRHRGELEQAHVRYREAHRLAHRTGDRGLQADIGNALAILARARGDHDEAILQYRAAIEAFDAQGGSSGYPRMNLANLHAHLGDLDEAVAGYHDAMGQARAQGNRAMEASITTNLGTVLLLTGDHDGAAEALYRALALHRQHGARRLEVATLLALADVTLERGHPSAAVRRFEEARELAEAAGLRLHAARAHYGLVRAALLHQDLPGAAVHLAAVEAMERDLGAPAEEARLWCVRGLVACAEGDRGRAEAALARVLDLVPDEARSPRSEIGMRVGELREALAEPSE